MDETMKRTIEEWIQQGIFEMIVEDVVVEEIPPNK